jgi:hypothetical protein
MKHVRRATMIALILAAAMPAALAAATVKLSGTYETKITTDGTLNGTYRVTFDPGQFTLHAPYGIVGHGTYSISGSKLTLHGPGACTAAGSYEVKVSGSWLTFKKFKDPCPRAAILTAHALKKV